jgi:cyclase
VRIIILLFLLIFSCILVQADPPTKHDFEMVQVADGIYSFIANESNSGSVQGNVTLIVGEKSAIVVDAGQFPSLAERMCAKIRELTQKPVRVLINTHWHGDHLLANYVFRERFPGLIVVAHAEALPMMVKYYGNWEEQVAGFPKTIETIREHLKTGKRRDGTLMDEVQKFGLQMDTDALEQDMPEVRKTKFEPPDMTFTKEIHFDLGNRDVNVVNYGWGNTAGDAVIIVPDAQVLITGDTVVYPTPYSFGSYHSEWIKVLHQLIDVDAKKIVPGHGPVMQDASYIKTLIALLEDVRTQVQAAVKEGLDLAAVRKRVTLDDWNSKLAGDNKYRQRAFHDFFLVPGIEQAYKEAKGEKLTE